VRREAVQRGQIGRALRAAHRDVLDVRAFFQQGRRVGRRGRRPTTASTNGEDGTRCAASMYKRVACTNAFHGFGAGAESSGGGRVHGGESMSLRGRGAKAANLRRLEASATRAATVATFLMSAVTSPASEKSTAHHLPTTRRQSVVGKCFATICHPPNKSSRFANTPVDRVGLVYWGLGSVMDEGRLGRPTSYCIPYRHHYQRESLSRRRPASSAACVVNIGCCDLTGV
jgi:hypothetical protein